MKTKFKWMRFIRILSLLLTISLFSTNSFSQTELWGVTTEGGTYDYGVIFKTDASGNNQTSSV
ncbi:MAG: hypothetical protein A2X12_08815 [Bacteroidetes bacterium GWE2_29_8]|nr:MAG: hypothetical protein A2X12_08815 [Bacteroidetes bacterium GWE2_29_8]OFY18344.1 MAG: hypothetical protein A2X02_08375 [Bacteroidetes bacterium GWF2_29_10]